MKTTHESKHEKYKMLYTSMTRAVTRLPRDQRQDSRGQIWQEWLGSVSSNQFSNHVNLLGAGA